MATVEYLNRFLDPFAECLTPEAAKRIAEWRADPQMQDRIDELADKCTEGELTPEEREEYESYVRTSTFVSILQAKARALLANKPES